MANRTEVLNYIDKAIGEVHYVKLEVEDLRANEDGVIDTSLIIKYIEDVEDAINKIRDSFEEYDGEVSDIGDDLEGLVKRLSEVIK